MTGGVDQVQVVGPAVTRNVGERRRLRLDGDAALTLDVHRIKHLRLHLTVGQAAATMDDAIGQGGFTVVDVGDDGEVADVIHGGNSTRSGAVEHLGGIKARGGF